MFRIREATPADNEALLRLEAQSPQGTGISLLIDRDDYFYRSRLHDQGKVLIAEEKDHLVGIMAYAIKKVLLHGTEQKVAYFYDLRGDAEYRRSMKRGLFRLWKHILAELEEAGVQFIYGHVKADNLDSLSVATKSGARPVATFDILALPTLKGRVVELDPHLDTLEEEVAQIETRVANRTLRPIAFSDAYLRGRDLGYLRGIFRLEEASSFAQLSAWDLSSIYRSRVLHMPLSLRFLGAMLNPVAKVAPVPSVPRVGEQITYLQLFDPVCSGPQGGTLMKRLVKQLRRNAHAAGIDILTLFAYRDDPQHIMPRFFPQEMLHYYTMVRPVLSDEPPEPPLYLDIRDI